MASRPGVHTGSRRQCKHIVTTSCHLGVMEGAAGPGQTPELTGKSSEHQSIVGLHTNSRVPKGHREQVFPEFTPQWIWPSCTHTYMYTCTHLHTGTHTCIHITHTIHTHTHTHMCTYIHAHTHKHKHTYTHAYKNVTFGLTRCRPARAGQHFPGREGLRSEHRLCPSRF